MGFIYCNFKFYVFGIYISILSYCFILVLKTMATNNRGECGEKRIIIHYWWDCRLVQSLWKIIKKLKKIYHISQLYTALVSVQRTSHSTAQILAQLCSLLHYSQQLRNGNNLNTLKVLNE